MVRTMRQIIQTSFAFRDYFTHHAFGQWFRFFLPWVIPEHVNHTIYVDPDVWFVSNLAALWGERDPGVMMQWGDESKCSGTMLLNLGMMRNHFWEVNLNSACQFLRWATTRPTLLALRGWIRLSLIAVFWGASISFGVLVFLCFLCFFLGGGQATL